MTVLQPTSMRTPHTTYVIKFNVKLEPFNLEKIVPFLLLFLRQFYTYNEVSALGHDKNIVALGIKLCEAFEKNKKPVSSTLHNTQPSIYKQDTEQWRIQDFPEVGAPTLQGRQHMILPNFPRNHMKLKEYGPRGGGHVSKILLCRSATADESIELQDVPWVKK